MIHAENGKVSAEGTILDMAADLSMAISAFHTLVHEHAVQSGFNDEEAAEIEKAMFESVLTAAFENEGEKHETNA